MRRVVQRAGILLTPIVAVSVIAVWIRAYSVSMRDLDLLASGLRLWTLPTILLLLALQVALAAFRWSIIEEALGAERPRFARAFTTGAIALGLGSFLPGFVTNVAARSLCNRLGGKGGTRGAVSGLIDQVSDLSTVILFLPAAILGIARQSLAAYVAAAGLTALAGFAALKLAAPHLQSMNNLRPFRGVRSKLEPLLRSNVLTTIYCISLLRFSGLTALTLLIHFATGSATTAAAVIAVPLVTVAISLAMLPGGIGISEWSFSAVFAALQISHEQIVLFVLGNRIFLSGAAVLLMFLALCHAALRWREASGPQERIPLNVRSI